MTKASLISSRDKDKPILRRRDRRLQVFLPVADVESRHRCRSDLLSGLFSRCWRSWDVGLGLAEPALYPISKRDLLLRRRDGRQKEEKRREMHDDELRAFHSRTATEWNKEKIIRNRKSQ